MILTVCDGVFSLHDSVLLIFLPVWVVTRTDAPPSMVSVFLTVNTVLPGGVGTPGAIAAEGPPPIGPGNRKPLFGYCEPRDIGSAVLYFATPAARYVTNQVICVDAGFSLS